MTFEEYLDLVVQTVTKNIKPGARAITAAALGVLLKQASPDTDWKTFGIRTLGELLSDPKIRPRLEIVYTDKEALAVAPTGAAHVEDGQAVEVFNPLRKSVWEAFVLGAPSGRRFMHRLNGAIRLGLDIAPAPADEWIEVTPVSVAEQREWARSFLGGSNDDRFNEAHGSLDSDDWHPYAFAQNLRREDESAMRQWNRFRSAKVSARVQEWLAQHALPSELGFQGSIQKRVEPHAKPTVARDVVPYDAGEETRQAILAAIASLPLDKLLEFPIPAGVLLSALSKTKTR